MDFTKLLAEMEEIQGQWDGDEPGQAEDRAMAATDVIEAVREIQENLEYLNDN